MSKKINNFNFLILYLYMSFFTYQTQLISTPISPSLLLFTFVIFLYIQTISLSKYRKNIFTLILILILSSMTLLYAPNKIEGIQRIVTFTSMILFVFVILYKQFNKYYINNFFKHTLILGVLYIFGSFILFDTLVDYKGEFEGFMHNRHNISALLGIYFIFILSYLFKINKIYLFVLLLPALFIDLYLIFYSYARIGFFIISIFLLSIVFIKFYKSSFIVKSIFLILIFVAVLYSISFVLQNEYIIYAIERGLTGRDEISANLLSHFKTNIFVLFIGFGAGSLDTLGSGLTYMAVRDVNNVIGVLFEYGIIGLGLFILIFINYIYKALILIKYNNNINYFTLIPISIILVPSETTWLNFNNFETIIMYIFIAYTFKEYAIYKKEREIEN